MEISDLQPLYGFENLYLIYRGGIIIPLLDDMPEPKYITENNKNYVIILDKKFKARKFLIKTLVKKTFRLIPILNKNKHVEGNKIQVISPNGSDVIFNNLMQVSITFNIPYYKLEQSLNFKNSEIDNFKFRSIPCVPNIEPPSNSTHLSASNPDDLGRF